MAATKASSPAAQTRAKPAAARKARIAAEQLIPLFTETLGAWHLLTLETPQATPAREPVAAVRAEYGQGDVEAALSITTRLAAPGGARSVHEDHRADRQVTSVTMSLGNGLLIVAISNRADAAALKGLIESMDLARAEALRPAPR